MPCVLCGVGVVCSGAWCVFFVCRMCCAKLCALCVVRVACVACGLGEMGVLVFLRCVRCGVCVAYWARCVARGVLGVACVVC